jgi:hypothetical protein
VKAAERLKLKAAIRARRAMVALLLVLALSFTTVFADDEINGTADPADGTQTEVSTGTEGGGQDTGTDATEGGEEPGTGEPSPEEPSPEEPEPEPEPAASIIKDGKSSGICIFVLLIRPTPSIFPK